MPIGADGIGEVYKVRDTRLNRTVAVKVSAKQFSERDFGLTKHRRPRLKHSALEVGYPSLGRITAYS
jgi:hypothetical protein